MCHTYLTLHLQGKKGNIIRSVQFEKGNVLSETQNLLSETRDDTESGSKYDGDSTLPQLISEEEMDTMS